MTKQKKHLRRSIRGKLFRAGSILAGSKKGKKKFIANKKYPTGIAVMYEEGGVKKVHMSDNMSMKDQMQVRKELKAAGWPIK